MAGRIIFVSDLHVFCRRSYGDDYFTAICEASAT